MPSTRNCSCSGGPESASGHRQDQARAPQSRPWQRGVSDPMDRQHVCDGHAGDRARLDRDGVSQQVGGGFAAVVVGLVGTKNRVANEEPAGIRLALEVSRFNQGTFIVVDEDRTVHPVERRVEVESVFGAIIQEQDRREASPMFFSAMPSLSLVSTLASDQSTSSLS